VYSYSPGTILNEIGKLRMLWKGTDARTVTVDDVARGPPNDAFRSSPNAGVPRVPRLPACQPSGTSDPGFKHVRGTSRARRIHAIGDRKYREISDETKVKIASVA